MQRLDVQINFAHFINGIIKRRHDGRYDTALNILHEYVQDDEEYPADGGYPDLSAK